LKEYDPTTPPDSPERPMCKGFAVGGVLGGVFTRRFPFLQRLFRVLGWSVSPLGADRHSAPRGLAVPTVGTSSPLRTF